MFEKNMTLAFLLDFYGEVLDSHTKDIMKAYYEDDLSLSEIADGEGISRQGVRHIIKKGEEQLLFLEEKLGLAEKSKKLNDAQKKLSDAHASLSKLNIPAIDKELSLIEKAIVALSVD